MSIVNISRISSSIPRLSDRWKLTVLIAAAICAVAQTGDDRYPFVRDGRVGFIDSRGNEVIAPQFFPVADMAHFRDGLAPVATPDGAGYIDASGRFVIGPNRQWGQPGPFHEGIAALLIWGVDGAPNTIAFIDQTGKIVFSGARASGQGYFAEGLMPLSDAGKWGFVDQSFRWVIPAKYDFAGQFSDGLAPVQVGEKWGYIGRDGKAIVPPKYALAWSFSEGLARIRMDITTGEQWMTVEGLRPLHRFQFGFVDKHGNEVIQPRFERATDFRQGRAFVMPPGSRRLAIIDPQGNLVHAPEYDQAGEFHQGLAAVCVNGKWGYVDTSGGWTIAPEFSSADEFRHDLARVSWEDGYGYIDRTGRVVWKAVTKTSSR